MITERKRQALHGLLVLPVLIGLTLLCFAGVVSSARGNDGLGVILSIVLLGLPTLVCYGGFFMVNPNEGRVLQLFGAYKGTVTDPGLRWANPFFAKARVSQRVRNFESGKLKVNDATGNPVEIAAVVVWKVVDTAEALFQVDDYTHFVHVQSEAALRNLATGYPYDSHDAGSSLRGNTNEIAEELKKEIQARLAQAGVQVIEARISHLAYAAEIASAMLRRQQASAIIAARQLIVEGAVSMVQMALAQLERDHIVELDEERKAAMVCNLLVILCGDRDAQPIVNTGTLHT